MQQLKEEWRSSFHREQKINTRREVGREKGRKAEGEADEEKNENERDEDDQEEEERKEGGGGRKMALATTGDRISSSQSRPIDLLPQLDPRFYSNYETTNGLTYR